MKKGVLVVCLALAITITVSAFAHKAITVSMKSQDIFYEGNRTNQEVIVHNNTTYVPLRSFSELVGVPVDYKNGVIYLGDTANNTSNTDTANDIENTSSTDPANDIDNTSNTDNVNDIGNTDNIDNITHNGSNLYIGKNKAKLIALQHAGVQKNDFTIVELRLNRDNNKMVYEVEFFTESKEYDYQIDAITGEIVSYDFDIEGFENNFIGQEKAEQIALNHAQLTKQQVEYIENDLDEDYGRWKYQIEFRHGTKEYEYDIDAQTGEVIDYSVDND